MLDKLLPPAHSGSKLLNESTEKAKSMELATGFCIMAEVLSPKVDMISSLLV